MVFEQFVDVVVHQTTYPDVAVVEYGLVGRVPSTGRRASARFVVVLRNRDGKVLHWREYQSVPAMMEVLSLLQ